MLNPDQITHFRAALAGDPALSRFDHLHCGAVDLRLGAAGPIWRQEQPAPVMRIGPEHVFGTPPDPACLHGIDPGPVSPPPAGLWRIGDAAVIGHDAVLANGCLFCPGPVATPEAARALANGHDSHGIVVTEHDAGFRVHHFRRAAPRTIPARALFLHNLEPGNYGSFLFRQLPQLLLAARLQPDVDCYVTPQRTPFLREALALLHLPPHPVYEVREVCGDRFREVLFANEFDAEGVFSPATLAGIRDLAQHRRVVENTPGPRRLFVSRALTEIARPWYRPLVNQAALESLAADRGYTICHPESWDLARQIAAFAGAGRIAGPSGSGMLNAVFAAKGARVLDLESVQVTVRQHANLYASTGKRYAFAFGDFAGASDAPPMVRPWQLDPALFQAGLDWLEA